jgi:glycosyltransferase involved in cell wall biosynthesis
MASNPISVLVVFSSSEIGGAEHSLSRMVIANVNPILSYEIATFGSIGALSNWLKSQSIDCPCFNNKTWNLIRYVYMNRPDIIYVVGFRLSVFLRFFCKIFTKNLIVQAVRWNPSSNSRLDKSFRLFERLFSFLIDGYIVNSSSAKALLKSISIDKVELIYNGISNFQNINAVVAKKNYVITVANLSIRKGYVEYLKIINNVVKDLPDAQFIFLGHDNLNGKVQKTIKDLNLSSNVKYLGFQSDVGHYLNESSVFVLPSLFGEGCPTSILEAFSHKLPVIAYQIDGIPELVSHNEDGFLINSGDIDSFVLAIKSLLLNPNKACEMGSKGYIKVKNNFLLENMSDKHNKYFLGLK